VKYYQRLKDIRKDNDKSQEQIARIIGTSQQQYGRWEQGIWQMPIEHYKTLALYYNVSIDYLSGLTNIPTTIDGAPYRISKNISITNKGGNNKINIKN